MESKETPKRLVKCTVVSDKMNKSRTGRISRVIKHKGVGKYISRSTKIMFHDENNDSRVGDQVLITEVKPMSAKKSFQLASIVKKHAE